MKLKLEILLRYLSIVEHRIGFKKPCFENFLMYQVVDFHEDCYATLKGIDMVKSWRGPGQKYNLLYSTILSHHTSSFTVWLKKQWICGRFSGLFIVVTSYSYVCPL